MPIFSWWPQDEFFASHPDEPWRLQWKKNFKQPTWQVEEAKGWCCGWNEVPAAPAPPHSPGQLGLPPAKWTQIDIHQIFTMLNTILNIQMLPGKGQRTTASSCGWTEWSICLKLCSRHLPPRWSWWHLVLQRPVVCKESCHFVASASSK